MNARPAPTASMPVDRRRRWLRRTLVAIALGYAGFLIIAPIVALVAGAFADGLGPALATFRDREVQKAFGLTLQISLLVVLVQAVFGTAVAWMLVRDDFWGKKIINGLIDLPFAVSPVVVGYMLLLLFGRQGLLAPVLQALDIRVAFAVPGMVLATLFVTLPFMIRELMPILQAFGVQQEQAAATLGAGGWTIFWRITLPALRWGFIYGVTLTLARALGEFGAVLVVGGGIQGRTETATIYIYRALDERQYVSAYSAALALGLFSLLLVLGTELLRRREAGGG
ncbi:MAG: sulfate ABC transporter permease subunit [Caldilineales bacterium]|nr:sulfate ABC transporter permease subunit [Caldilineales bacterium]MDW8319358.1 sulfate ABC transporter permease subunit [Anaerolineae bacterium]